MATIASAMALRCFAACVFFFMVGSLVHAETGMLRVQITDAETQQQIAARVVLRSSDGKYPGDRIGLSRNHWPNLEAHGVFIAGPTSFQIPTGKTFIQASCGPQYSVESREIDVAANGSAVVELQLKRLIDLKKLGWVCGDAHLHMIHGEMQRAGSYEEIAVTCRANGLDWAYVNQEYVGAGEHSLGDYHSECNKVSTETFQLLLGGERPKSLLGHNALIGVQNPFVVPDDPPYHRAAAAVHSQGGVLFPVHPVRYYPGKQYQGQWLDFPGNNLGREIIFDAYLGPSFDGLSVLSDEPDDPRAYQLWFNLLNKGFFVPAFADSDACFDRPSLQKNVPGFWSTYLYVGPDGKAGNSTLADAVRRGETMSTTGPLIVWDIDGQRSGANIPADGKSHRVTIRVLHAHHNWTLENEGVARVELIRNGKVVRVWEPKTSQATLSHQVVESESSWYVVRAFGTDSRWQVGVTSPIYFGREENQKSKKKPLTVRVRGRIYDFLTGTERTAQVTVKRNQTVLKQFEADGQFAVDMPLDASLVVVGDGHSVTHDLLLDYAPVHDFLWKLDSQSLANADTLDRFEALLRQVELEFPLGYRMSGCYAAKALNDDVEFHSVRLRSSPMVAAERSAVAAILLDKRQIRAGDVINVAAVFHDQAEMLNQRDPLLVVEGRAYDARRPTGFNPLKVFQTVEVKWSQAKDAGEGYRILAGKLTVPEWVEPGPVHGIEINVLSRGAGGKYESHVGLRIPLGATIRALMVVSNWPTVPISWHDHNYGIGPLKICGKIGRDGQPNIDYRALRMAISTSAGDFEVWPEADCRGCPDADDAVFASHYLHQILNDESKLRPAESIRPQPLVTWRNQAVIDAAGP